MKRMLLFHYSYGYEEVWDTGKRKTTINEYRKKTTFHWVQRKCLWFFKYHSWVQPHRLSELPQVEYWQEEWSKGDEEQ